MADLNELIAAFITGREWFGDTPVFLLIVKDEKLHILDVDERGCWEIHADLMRGASTWHMMLREGHHIFSLVVHDGEQPYYTGKALANSRAPDLVIRAYGIGKKLADGHVQRLWMFADGQICGGEDVFEFGQAKLMAKMAQLQANPMA